MMGPISWVLLLGGGLLAAACPTPVDEPGSEEPVRDAYIRCADYSCSSLTDMYGPGPHRHVMPCPENPQAECIVPADVDPFPDMPVVPCLDYYPTDPQAKCFAPSGILLVPCPANPQAKCFAPSSTRVVPCPANPQAKCFAPPGTRMVRCPDNPQETCFEPFALHEVPCPENSQAKCIVPSDRYVMPCPPNPQETCFAPSDLHVVPCPENPQAECLEVVGLYGYTGRSDKDPPPCPPARVLPCPHDLQRECCAPPDVYLPPRPRTREEE